MVKSISQLYMKKHIDIGIKFYDSMRIKKEGQKRFSLNDNLTGDDFKEKFLSDEHELKINYQDLFTEDWMKQYPALLDKDGNVIDYYNKLSSTGSDRWIKDMVELVDQIYEGQIKSSKSFHDEIFRLAKLNYESMDFDELKLDLNDQPKDKKENNVNSTKKVDVNKMIVIVNSITDFDKVNETAKFIKENGSKDDFVNFIKSQTNAFVKKFPNPSKAVLVKMFGGL